MAGIDISALPKGDSDPTVAGGNTNIAAALRRAIDDILASTAPQASRNIVIFSDGKHNDPNDDPYAEAERACDNNIFVHTIAYAMRGILEVGVSVECDRYISSAVKVGDAMVQAMPAAGALPGRYDSNRRPTVNWSCLTGVAQMAVNLGRLYQMTGRSEYLSAMKKATRFVMTTQKLRGDSNELGGIKGSHPINGGYHPWQYPNWSAKFFADALMLEHEITE